jgi:hypothetical protein
MPTDPSPQADQEDIGRPGKEKGGVVCKQIPTCMGMTIIEA